MIKKLQKLFDKNFRLRSEVKCLRALNVKMSKEFKAQRCEFLGELNAAYSLIDQQATMLTMLKKEVPLEVYMRIKAVSDPSLTALAAETIIESVERGL